MKKIFFIGRFSVLVLVGTLVLASPVLAVEANVDITANTDVTVTTSGQTITVIVESGSKADSMEVNAVTGTVTVTLGNEDTFTISDTLGTRRVLFTVDGGLTPATTCLSAKSSLILLAPTATTTYVLAPRLDLTCPGGGSTSGGTSTGGGGGGGGGSTTPAPTPTPAPAPTPTPAPSPTTPSPTSSASPAGAHPNGTLIVDGNGTIYLIANGAKRGFRNPEEYFSHGYSFSQAVSANETDLALPDEAQPVAKALDGTLALDKSDGRTIYMIADGAKRGFTSAEVFFALGYTFEQAVPIDLSDYPAEAVIDSATPPHPDGALVLDKNDGRTVWWILGGQRLGFQSAEVFNTYGFSFGKIVPANDSDMALPEGSLVKFRDGTLVRDGDSYYLISDGLKRRFESVSVLQSLGFKLENAIDALLTDYSEGAVVVQIE